MSKEIDTTVYDLLTSVSYWWMVENADISNGVDGELGEACSN